MPKRNGRSGRAVVDCANVNRAPMRREEVEHLVIIGVPTEIVVEFIAMPPLSALRPVRANVVQCSRAR